MCYMYIEYIFIYVCCMYIGCIYHLCTLYLYVHDIATEVKARVEVLFRFKSLCEAHLQELTELVVKEHGKNRGEAEAEVLKGGSRDDTAL